MKQFKTVFEYVEKLWVASCEELRITLEEGSFDALVVRMKIAVQEIAELELGHKGDIQLVISMPETEKVENESVASFPYFAVDTTGYVFDREEANAR